MRLFILAVGLAAAWLLWTPTAQKSDSRERRSAGSGAAHADDRHAGAQTNVGCVSSPDFRLVATLVVSGPLPSMAVVTDDTGPSRVVAVGGALGPRRVTAIDREQLVLDGVECVRRRTIAKAPPAPKPPAKDGHPVSRALVKRYLEHPKRLAKEIRARFVGKPPRVRITRVAKDSLFAKLGLRRGDILHTVAGKPIESLNDALELLDDLLAAESVDVVLRRRGRPVEFTVALH